MNTTRAQPRTHIRRDPITDAIQPPTRSGADDHLSYPSRVGEELRWFDTAKAKWVNSPPHLKSAQ